MNARERIMQRLRTPGKAPATHLPDEVGLPGGGYDLEQLIAQWHAHGVPVYRAANLAAARLHLATWLQEQNIHTLVGWPEHAVGLPGLHETLHALGITWHLPPYAELEAMLLKRPEGLAGLTGVHGVVGPTGTLVLVDGPHTPLLPAIVPPVHVAVILPHHLFHSLRQWWHHYRPQTRVLTLQCVPRVWALGAPPVSSGLGPQRRYVIFVEDAEEPVTEP